MLWRSIIRPLFFCLPAESAHHLAMSCFAWAMKIPAIAKMTQRHYSVLDPRLQSRLFGVDFPNPVGLAAGFDKDGKWFQALSHLGFGYVEIGTLTAHAQSGNPRPRLFRLPRDAALINRLGFNNQGSQAAAARLAKLKNRSRVILGVNIGKSRVTELDMAADDYRTSFDRLFEFADYFTINVSSPNTPGLRQLQNRADLEKIVSAIQDVNSRAAAAKPLLLKIAPDLADEQIDELADLAMHAQLDGIIATNTTTAREPLVTPANRIQQFGAGGLSGRPLTERSRKVVGRLFARLQGRVPIIGCGGVMSGEDAWNMICSGAALLQVYTGFVYGGPDFVRKINRFLLDRMDREGLTSISQAIGRNQPD